MIELKDGDCRLLFHGTNREYHDEMLKKYGRYQHGLTGEFFNRVCVTERYYCAAGYAFRKAEAFGERLNKKLTPIVLVIAVSRLSCEIINTPTFGCSWLDKDNYFIHESGRFDSAEYKVLEKRIREELGEIPLVRALGHPCD